VTAKQTPKLLVLRLNSVVSTSILRVSKHTKINSSQGFAPDPTGGAYSTPPDPLAGVEGG